MLDGKIARKYNLITDFGKFIDPLADKFMVIGASIAILYRYENIRSVFIWFLTVVIFRELAISSIRLIASTTGGVVIAASILGKIKTVSQIVCICAVLIEPLLYPADFILHDILPLTYISIAVATVFTVWSGINYIRSYWKFIDPQK
jgi:CDP-diacylglycerol--glycerol-3-phosphate 3-phosphatidyltransferase